MKYEKGGTAPVKGIYYYYSLVLYFSRLRSTIPQIFIATKAPVKQPLPDTQPQIPRYLWYNFYLQKQCTQIIIITRNHSLLKLNLYFNILKDTPGKIKRSICDQIKKLYFSNLVEKFSSVENVDAEDFKIIL